MNDAFSELSEEQKSDLERFSNLYIDIKDRYKQLEKIDTNYKLSRESVWSYQIGIQGYPNLLKTIKEGKKEVKSLFQEASRQDIPLVQHFSDIVDEMMFRFRDSKKTNLVIQKISPHNYRFGTKRILAHVNNNVLLIRVGGGYQNIDSFWKLYGE